jgi:hypothetical protein
VQIAPSLDKIHEKDKIFPLVLGGNIQQYADQIARSLRQGKRD